MLSDAEQPGEPSHFKPCKWFPPGAAAGRGTPAEAQQSLGWVMPEFTEPPSHGMSEGRRVHLASQEKLQRAGHKPGPNCVRH